MGWRIEPAGSADLSDVCRCTYRAMWSGWLRQEISPQEERILVCPQSSLLKRSLHSMGGTLLAMQHAFTRGVGIKLAGGTHHAFRDRGEGFCEFNDLAIATAKRRLRPSWHRACLSSIWTCIRVTEPPAFLPTIPTSSLSACTASEIIRSSKNKASSMLFA